MKRFYTITLLLMTMALAFGWQPVSASALSADRAAMFSDGALALWPVVATETCYKNGLVTVDTATGYAHAGQATSGHVCVGFARWQADNSGGSSGDVNVSVQCTGQVEMVGAGLADTDLFKMAYITDDQTVTTTPNAYPVGPITRVLSATSCLVDISGARYFADQTGDRLVSPTIETSILDANGNELWKLTATGTAVNEITVANAAAGSGPTQTSTGGDTNIPHTIAGKGTGAVILGQATSEGVKLAADQPILDSSGNEYMEFAKAASAVNQIKLGNAATGGSPTIGAGGETNTGIDVKTRGTGIGVLVGDDADCIGWSKDGAAKVGFYSVASAPVVQPTAYTQTYSTADKTHAAATMAALTDSSGGTPNNTIAAISTGGAAADQAPTANAIATLAREQAAAKADILDLKQLVNALIDDLQAVGLAQ